MENMDMEHEDLRQEWQKLLEEKNLRALKAELAEANEVDVAEFVEELGGEKALLVFRMLPKGVASDVFANLEVENQQTIISSITDQEITELVE